MPKSPEEMMNYEEMLDELAAEYPSVEASAMDLKTDLLDLMPGDEMPAEQDELSLEEAPEDLELGDPELGAELPEPTLDPEDEEDEFAGY